jgi:pimeloyl-ACP methyl ester carboxylesterase
LLDTLPIAKADVVGWSDGAILGLDLAIRHPDRVGKVFAFAANTVTSGVQESVEKNPTFAAFIERAGHEYAKLSATPKDYDPFLAQISKMWETEPNWTDAQLPSWFQAPGAEGCAARAPKATSPPIGAGCHCPLCGL